MARIILVRHCESEANRLGPERGGSDAPLSQLGRLQAAMLRQSFEQELSSDRTLGRAVLLSSPLRHAAETALEIGAALRVAGHHDPRLGAGETFAGQYDLKAPATLALVGADVLAALREQATAGADLVVAVSHRYAIWALLTVLYGDRGTDIMDEVNDLGNGDRLEVQLVNGCSSGEPSHRPLADLGRRD